MNKKIDWALAVLCVFLLFGFIGLMIFNPAFNELAWARHHNILSWYIRPLMMLPFCYFAFKRSWAGMMGSILALLTSMMWFSVPDFPAEQVQNFLLMEQDYLSSEWGMLKIITMLFIPIFFFLTGWAFWHRSYLGGLLVLVLGAMIKMLWSVLEGGESGAIVLPIAGGGDNYSGRIYTDLETVFLAFIFFLPTLFQEFFLTCNMNVCDAIDYNF